jgi:starch synthase (maltosyl-transferring)
VVIEHVQPEIDGGYFPIKRIIGEKVKVTADIFADGHDQVRVALLFRKQGKEKWQFSPMNFVENVRWSGEFKEYGIEIALDLAFSDTENRPLYFYPLYFP